MGFETIVVENNDHVCKITLNRPEVLNATNETMGIELNQALHDAETDRDTRSIILTGAGRAFCAGEDVEGFRTRSFAALDELLRKKYHPIILRLRRIPKPIIAALNGIAAGGGASIALACDIRIASELASIKMAFIGMGLVPDAGSSYFLTKLVGSGRALELVLTGRTVSATEAQAIGLVSKVVPPQALGSVTDVLASSLAEGPQIALRLSKQLMNQVSSKNLADALEDEAHIQKVASETSEHKEAVNAFLEKRTPRFT